MWVPGVGHWAQVSRESTFTAHWPLSFVLFCTCIVNVVFVCVCLVFSVCDLLMCVFCPVCVCVLSVCNLFSDQILLCDHTGPELIT